MPTTKISNSYRPKTINSLIAQDHIKRAIIRSCNSACFSSCYLFSGKRGTGKTTVARLFSKYANCTSKCNQDCCNKCLSCTAINDQSSFELIEVDGASNRGVESISRVKEMASSGISGTGHRFIVIDEAHMLSAESFNTLLKVLEETPESTSFILITTERKKLPSPIISRSIPMLFLDIPEKLIKAKIKAICKDLCIVVEEYAFDIISKQAFGCVRDAESLLESALLCRSEESQLSVNDVLNTVNKMPLRDIWHIDELRSSNDPKNILNFSHSVANSEFNCNSLLESLAEHFYFHMLCLMDKQTHIHLFYREYYEENLKIYSLKELKNILAGILAVEAATTKSESLRKTWVILLIQKIASGYYKVNYIDFLNVVLQEKADGFCQNTAKCPKVKQCILQFLQKELAQ